MKKLCPTLPSIRQTASTIADRAFTNSIVDLHDLDGLVSVHAEWIDRERRPMHQLPAGFLLCRVPLRYQPR
jgi:hypothetical protein